MYKVALKKGYQEISFKIRTIEKTMDILELIEFAEDGVEVVVSEIKEK